MASLLTLSLVLTQAAAGLVWVKVEEGDTVTLDCRDSRTPIRAVEWIKDDQPQKNILFYSGGRYYPDHQHSTFKDRVELTDLHHKGGDMSLRLKDVTVNDSGTYQCLVAAGVSRRSKRSFIDGEPVATIELEVRGSVNDNTVNEPLSRSIVGSVAGSVLLLVVVVVIVGVVVFRSRVYKTHRVKRSEEDGAVKDQLIKHSEEQQNPDSSP